MRKEPKTVKSNVVERFMDISAQDSSVEFQQSDFQDEMDTAILVRERAKGSKLESTFAKKTGKIVNETDHTVSILLESSQPVKTFSKRDIASASGTQKEKSRKHPKENESLCRTPLATVKRKCRKRKRQKWGKEANGRACVWPGNRITPPDNRNLFRHHWKRKRTTRNKWTKRRQRLGTTQRKQQPESLKRKDARPRYTGLL